MSFHIRQATTLDRPFLADMLLTACFPSHLEISLDDAFEFPHFVSWLSAEEDISKMAIIACDTNGRSIGAALWHCFARETEVPGWLDDDIPVLIIAVTPTMRHQGVASMLLKATIKSARGKKTKAFSGQVSRQDIAAVKLAKKNKFQVADDTGASLLVYRLL